MKITPQRLPWKILHDGKPIPGPRSAGRQKLAQALRRLGYSVTLTEINPTPMAQASA